MYAPQETLTHDWDWVDMVSTSVQNQVPSVQTPLSYSTSAVEGGFLLTIWESAPPTSSRPAAYLYKINHRLETQEELQGLLDWYLSCNASAGYTLPAHSANPANAAVPKQAIAPPSMAWRS